MGLFLHGKQASLLLRFSGRNDLADVFLDARQQLPRGDSLQQLFPPFIQWEPPMNLMDVNTLFPTDAKCRELMTRLRFPEGPRCLRCKGSVVELETEKQLFYCKDCDYQFSVTAGTVFNDSHLPLATWLAATLLLCEAKKGMSACQIQRTLGIGGNKNAWDLCHRLPHVMAQTHKPMFECNV